MHADQELPTLGSAHMNPPDGFSPEQNRERVGPPAAVSVARRSLRPVLAEPGGPLSRVVDEDPHGTLLGQRDRQGNPDGEEPAHVVVMLGLDVPDDVTYVTPVRL